LRVRADEVTLECATSAIHVWKDRRRNACFHSPKILVGNEFHTRFGFPGLLAARPGDSRAHPAAIIETDAGENVATVQLMPAYEAKAVHAQQARFGLLLPGLLRIFGANQNGDADAHARSAPQSAIEFRGPQENIKQLSSLQIIGKFRGASDARRFAHALFQEAAGQFSVLAVEMRFVNLRRNGFEMPVGPSHEMHAAHLAFIERSDGGFDAPFGGAFESH
jgi:hypothetical protein